MTKPRRHRAASALVLLALAGGAAQAANEKIEAANRAASATGAKIDRTIHQGASKAGGAIDKAAKKTGDAITRGAKRLGLPTAGASAPGAGEQVAK